jgi:hypothetical protein
MSERICLQLKTGSCAGCDIIRMAREKFRYEQISPDEAADAIQAEYCPSGAYLDRNQLRNRQAMYAFGQDQKENTDFTGVNNTPRGRKLFR